MIRVLLLKLLLMVLVVIIIGLHSQVQMPRLIYLFMEVDCLVVNGIIMVGK